MDRQINDLMNNDMRSLSGGDEDSISNITKGLFNDISELKEHKSDLYDYDDKDEDSLDLKKSDLFDKYEYYKDEKEDKKHKYDRLNTPKNPLDDYVNEYFEDKEVIDRLSEKETKELEKEAYKESSMEYVMSFRKLVDKIEKQLYKWIPNFDCYNYIIKDGSKYRCVRSLKELDKTSSTKDNEKVKFLRKLINDSAFTDQIMTKYIRKYDTNPEFITEKDYSKIKKFYEENIIKAFKKVISKYKY